MSRVRKRTLDDIEIGEISVVDRPAQEGATMKIEKQETRKQDGDMMSRLRMLMSMSEERFRALMQRMDGDMDDDDMIERAAKAMTRHEAEDCLDALSNLRVRKGADGSYVDVYERVCERYPELHKRAVIGVM